MRSGLNFHSIQPGALSLVLALWLPCDWGIACLDMSTSTYPWAIAEAAYVFLESMFVLVVLHLPVHSSMPRQGGTFLQASATNLHVQNMNVRSFGPRPRLRSAVFIHEPPLLALLASACLFIVWV